MKRNKSKIKVPVRVDEQVADVSEFDSLEVIDTAPKHIVCVDPNETHEDILVGGLPGTNKKKNKSKTATSKVDSSNEQIIKLLNDIIAQGKERDSLIVKQQVQIDKLTNVLNEVVDAMTEIMSGLDKLEDKIENAKVKEDFLVECVSIGIDSSSIPELIDVVKNETMYVSALISGMDTDSTSSTPPNDVKHSAGRPKKFNLDDPEHKRIKSMCRSLDSSISRDEKKLRELMTIETKDENRINRLKEKIAKSRENRKELESKLFEASKDNDNEHH